MDIPSSQPSGSEVLEEDGEPRKLVSEIRNLEATIRVSVNNYCPMSSMGGKATIQNVNQTSDGCTVEYVTEDLGDHCEKIEKNGGTCESEVDVNGGAKEIVRVSAQKPDDCICCIIDEHGGSPNIEGYKDGSIIANTTFSNREVFKSMISELQEVADFVQVDCLQETNPEDSNSQSVIVDLSILTDKQRDFLQTALQMGYFDSPRNISQTELADELGISPSMVSRRVRSIEQRIFVQTQSGLDL